MDPRQTCARAERAGRTREEGEGRGRRARDTEGVSEEVGARPDETSGSDGVREGIELVWEPQSCPAHAGQCGTYASCDGDVLGYGSSNLHGWCVCVGCVG